MEIRPYFRCNWVMTLQQKQHNTDRQRGRRRKVKTECQLE